MNCPTPWHTALAAAGLVASAAAHAQAPLCSSDGHRPARALLERFISADCADCWGAADSPPAPANALALDWVLPGALGDDAPLAAVARRDALDRIEIAGLRLPGARKALSNQVQTVIAPLPPTARLRVAHGVVLGGYVGASLHWRAPAGARGPFTGWLALVELLPAGTEGSPVARALVRNLHTQAIAARAPGPFGQIWRTLNVPEGAAPQRLEVLGWVSDARGRVLAAAQSVCPPAP